MTEDLKSQFWTDFEQLMLRMQRSLHEQEVADAVASDSRAMLGCDRIAVASRKGRSVQILAVSGQSSVNPRANLIAAMAKLARRVIEMGETLKYTGRIEGLAPQVEEPWQPSCRKVAPAWSCWSPPSNHLRWFAGRVRRRIVNSGGLDPKRPAV